MRVILALGNPGPRYDATRHNVGWWAADYLVRRWRFGAWREEGPALASRGEVEGEEILLLKPLTYMNRSGAVLARLRGGDFDPAGHLLVLVDDVALSPGKLRFRAKGSAGGHNGLRSIESVLGGGEYARLRIGVGERPRGMDLADWVLSPMDAADEEAVLARLPDIGDAVECWMRDGVEAAMNRFNG
jgi:peptidyl-tRNA hydrolase, PTH1 family